jgi:hypothetical protein
LLLLSDLLNPVTPTQSIAALLTRADAVGIKGQRTGSAAVKASAL